MADSATLLQAQLCPYAQVSDGGKIEREGVEILSGLSDIIARIQRVVLLLEGSSLTLLRVKVPPLSAARLKAALPNLVEEYLLCDPAECVIVAGGLSEGFRTLVVMQRAWLEMLDQTFSAFGARQISVLPAQLCLPCQSAQPDIVTAAINERNDDIDITLRLSEQEGMGLLIGPVPGVAEGIERTASAAHEVIRTLCAVVPAAPITLYVPSLRLASYQEAAKLNERISILPDSWSHWISGARANTLDLMAGLVEGAGSRINWRPWRWSLALSVTFVLINATALNIEWWRMQREESALRTYLIQIYKSAYPKESVILDPLVQMQQKIASAKRHSGRVAADDFTAITASFGEAWDSIKKVKDTPMIAALEYRERSLFVRLKPGDVVSLHEMKTALAQRGLSLEVGGGTPSLAQTGEIVWKIRSAQ